MRNIITISIVAVLSITTSYGQILDTLLTIKGIEIVDSISFIQSQKEVSSSFSLSIANTTNLFVKNYGPSSIATLSYRGGNASQIGVEWNGVTIANPMLGLTDIGIVHSYMIDKAKISTDNLNSASLIGTMQLSSTIQNNRSFNIYNSIGSFGLREHGFTARFNKRNWAGEFRLLRVKSENDYPYQLTNGEQRITKNASSRMNGVQGLLRYMLSKKSSINLSVWSDDYLREIPKLTTQTRSVARQIDRNLRSALSYQYNGERYIVNTTIGYIDGFINYQDSIINLEAKTDFNTIDFKSNIVSYSNLGKSNLDFNNEYTQSFAAAYGEEKFRNVSALRLGHQTQMIGISWSGFVGVKKANQTNAIPTYGARISKMLSGQIQTHLDYRRSLRFPTTNDLYWGNGGNEELLPEQADKFEAGIQYASNNLSVKLDGYHRLTNNWILWALPTNEPFFAVFNIAKVQSYGLEAKANWKNKINAHHSFKVGTHINLGRSINKIEIANPRINSGDQLLYTPTHSIKSNINYTYKIINLRLQQQLYSRMQGINQSIPPYQLFDLGLSIVKNWKRLDLELDLKVENILNQNYRIIEFRPMPGRNYKLTFQINI